MRDSTAKKLSDLWAYGVGYAYLFAAVLLGTVVGALLGWITLSKAGAGAAVGFWVGLLAWLWFVIAAHRHLRHHLGRHRQ